MNNDKFDKELASLYQERKSTISAPEIQFNQDINSSDSDPKANINLKKIISIFTLGSIASFSIFAVVTHFINQPIKNDVTLITSHSVEIVELTPQKNSENLILTIPELPAKPTSANVDIVESIAKPGTEKAQISSILPQNFTVTQTIRIPQLAEPTLPISPVFKEIPKYPKNAVYKQKTGMVKLSYSISDMGRVNNINVEESDLHRDFQKSAIKSLANWQYNPNDKFNDRYEIIFEFKTEDY